MVTKTKHLPALAMELPRDAIEDFCRGWKITELAVFGSVLRDDCGPESDIDFLVTYAPEATWSLIDVVGAEYELEDLVGHKVDFVSRKGLERSRDRPRRDAILGTAQVLRKSG